MLLPERSVRITLLARNLRARQLTSPLEELAVSFVHMWLNRLHRSGEPLPRVRDLRLLSRLREAQGARASVE